jgi:hypothetical protein
MPGEQLLGFLQASLSDAQIGEPHERVTAQRSVSQTPQADGVGKRDIGLRPASRRGQDRAVVRVAERRDGGKPASLGDRLTRPDPLIRARDVAGVLAGPEELTEDLLRDDEIVDLAAHHRRERLVEQQHALVRPVGTHEARAEIPERRALQVHVAEAPRHRERLTEPLLLYSASALEPRAVERHPAALERLRRVAQQRPRASQPALHDRSVAHNRAVHVREHPRDPHRARQVAAVTVNRVGLLPAIDRLRVVEVEVRRPRQALDRVTGRRFGKRPFEGTTSAGGVAGSQRRAPFGDQLLDRRGHAPIIAPPAHAAA